MATPVLPTSVLLPVEQAALTTPALETVADLAQHFRFELALLHVWEPLPFTPSEAGFFDQSHIKVFQQAAEARGAAMLSEVATRALQLGFTVSHQLVRCGNPSEEIVRVARELNAGWIVIPSHQRRGLSRWFLGSVAEKVAATAACPVLTVPVPD